MEARRSTIPLAVATRTVSSHLRGLPADANMWWPLAAGGAVIGGVSPASLALLLTDALRTTAPATAARPAFAILLDRPTSTLRLCAEQALLRAARSPSAIVVDAAPHDPRRVPLTAALHLAAATMRRRSPAAWRALDALDTHGGNAAAAARALGCSPQSVREHRARADSAATAHLTELLTALLQVPGA